MKLTDIVAISGQPGLFKYVAQSSNGIIVESLVDGRRSNASGSSKVSALAEISVYTDEGDKPLAEVLTAVYAHTGGKEAISHKSAPEQLKAFFAQAIPNYDRDLVHVSDMKKIVSWFNLLVSAGMSDFSVETAEESEEDTDAEGKSKEEN